MFILGIKINAFMSCQHRRGAITTHTEAYQMCPSSYDPEFANRAVIKRGCNDLPQTQGTLHHSRPVTSLNADKETQRIGEGGGEET